MPNAGEWIIWSLGVAAAVAGLVRLAIRRRQALVDALTEYVRSAGGASPPSEPEQESE